MSRVPVACAESLLKAHALGVLQREFIGQQFQQVARPAGADAAAFAVVGALDVFAEKLHLAPQVVVQAPAHKLLNALLPLHAVGHVEHTGFQPGDDAGTVREIPVGLVLTEAGKVGALALQLADEPEGLRAVDGAACAHQGVDVGLERLVEGGVVSAVDGLFASDFLGRDGAASNPALRQSAPAAPYTSWASPPRQCRSLFPHSWIISSGEEIPLSLWFALNII